jgi:large subunit ribosomal protein L25
VDVEGLEIGSHITAADLTLPTGAALAGDPEQILLLVQEAPSAAAMEGETVEEAVAPEAAAEEAPESED